MQYLKHVMLLGVALAAVGGGVYVVQKNPCDSPTGYRFGRIDAGFGISEQDLRSSVEEAVAIWEEPLGKPLFTYDPKGKLVISLVYDERQQTTQQNAELKADVEEISKLATDTKAEYERLLSNLNTSKQRYNDELERFNAKQKNYNNQVEYWNERGGAPPAEYNVLQTERNALTEQQALLEKRRVAMNETVSQINAFIQKYNLLVKNANANIHVINKSAGQEFQEGSYDSSTDTITIYEYSTLNKLTRVLAHEFGHALDLDHNKNTNSIMYALNKSNSLTLSKEDVDSLKKRCRINN